MGRNATIKITNNTSHQLQLGDVKVEHGKFNAAPPKTIDSHGQWEVGNHTGAKIGPKGQLEYKLMKPDHISVICTITFTWNHPFSSADSAYGATADKPGIVVLTPDKNRYTGHEQTVVWTIGLISR